MKARVVFAASVALAAVVPGASGSAEPPILPSFDIYAIGINGAGQRQLTADPADDLSPALSPDGTTIAFARGKDLWLMSSDGTNQRLLASAPQRFEYVQPSWSADGRFIAFTEWIGSLCIQGPYNCVNPSVWVIRPNGSGLQKVLDEAQSPRWSPSGHRLVLAADHGDSDPYQREPTSIYVESASGNGLRLAHVDRGSVGSPSWSPDGRRILYTRTTDGGSFIYTVRSDRRGSRRLLRGERAEWSRHGDRIAYSINGRLYLARGHGRLRARRIGFANWYSWNRRGTMLGLVDWRLSVIRRDGRGFRPLCCAPQHFGFGNDAPAWSRNGRTLFYAFKPESLPPS